LERKIRSRVKRQMEKTQREYYLNEQLKAIQKELGEGEKAATSSQSSEERIKKTKLSKEAREKASAEMKKLRSMSPMSGRGNRRAQLPRLDAVAPLGQEVQDQEGYRARRRVLNDDHYGLEKVKERILEYLAVQTRSGKMKGPILCLVGPPGVGKTVARQVDRACNRT
jgi:ATP-dependent Lon protease